LKTDPQRWREVERNGVLCERRDRASRILIADRPSELVEQITDLGYVSGYRRSPLGMRRNKPSIVCRAACLGHDTVEDRTFKAKGCPRFGRGGGPENVGNGHRYLVAALTA